MAIPTTENRWAEYDAGTLTPPVIVQHDRLATGEHLAWVYTTTGVIVGPISRESFGAPMQNKILDAAEAAVAVQYEIISEDETVIQV